MTELLRDSIWTFVGTIVAVVAILVAIFTYYGQRERKRMMVESIARVPLLSLGKQGIDGLQLTFNGEPLSQASVLLLRLTNQGNRPILASDFESSIEFEFPSNAVVLAADVVSTQPEGIPISISSDRNLATLSKHLLNPGDSVTCRVLLKNHAGAFTVKGRIAGVKDIERTRQTTLVPSLVSLASMATFMVAFFLAPTPHSSSLSDLRVEELPYLAAMLLAMIGMMAASGLTLKANLRKAQEERRLTGRNEV